MSGPVVVIGFILLIPSILGMTASGLILLGVLTYGGAQNQQTSVSAQSPAGDFDISFRRACIERASNKISLRINERYCECALEAYRATNSVDAAKTECEAEVQAELQNGTPGAVASDVEDLYDTLIEQGSPSYNTDIFFIRGCMKRGDGASPMSGNIGIPAQQYCQCELNETKSGKSLIDAQQACIGAFPEISLETQSIYHRLSQVPASRNASMPAQPQSSNTWLVELLHIAGSGFAVVLGIGSFVSGLLGWLLVMKKRVLQCSVCGATVSAA